MDKSLSSEQTDPQDYTLVPFNDGVDEKLRRPTYASYYLADAIECSDEDPGSVVAALQDIICANRSNTLIPMLAIFFSIPHISGEELEQITDFMSEELHPELATAMVGHGTFQGLRELAKNMKKYGCPPDELTLSFGRTAPDSPVLENARTALEKACADIFDTTEFRDMKSVLQPV